MARSSIDVNENSYHRSGIIYISRIPPFMKPSRVTDYFSKYGKVGRVYLQQEDESIASKRRKFRGNKKKNYTEGWVEFRDKRTAKQVAFMLNNRPVGGKKRSFFHDDLWNIKYLHQCKWSHITGKIVYLNAVRNQRLHTELSQTKKEIAAYLDGVDEKKSKKIMVQQRRKFQVKTKIKIAQDVTMPVVNHESVHDSLLKKIISD